MTAPTDEIEAALDREHVLCDCDEKAGENGGHWASCALRVRGPRIAAFIAEREAGLRKALAEQMDNTIAHQKRADVALDWNRLSVKQRDELQAKLDEAENIARQNGYERDELREWNDRAIATCAKRGCSMMESTIREQRTLNDQLAFDLGGLKWEVNFLRSLIRRVWGSASPHEDESISRDIVKYLAGIPATEKES